MAFWTPLSRDQRAQPGAYITDGKRLVEVTAQLEGAIRGTDCKDGATWTVTHQLLASKWRLVRRAPAAPQFPPDS